MMRGREKDGEFQATGSDKEAKKNDLPQLPPGHPGNKSKRKLRTMMMRRSS